MMVQSHCQTLALQLEEVKNTYAAELVYTTLSNAIEDVLRKEITYLAIPHHSRL